MLLKILMGVGILLLAVLITYIIVRFTKRDIERE